LEDSSSLKTAAAMAAAAAASMDFVMVDLSKQRQQQQQQHPTIYPSVQMQLPTATSTCRLTCAQQTGQQQRLSAAKTDGQEQQHVYVHPEGNSGPNLIATQQGSTNGFSHLASRLCQWSGMVDCWPPARLMRFSFCQKAGL
jgi:hypothetical protein